MITLTGKMSTFGGPYDGGVNLGEGLALYQKVEQRPELFLDTQPSGTTGLARRLNPAAHYVACRWNYSETPLSFLRSHQVQVLNYKTNAKMLAWPADWGPNAGTGRVADLSPGLAKALGLETDQMCHVIVPDPLDMSPVVHAQSPIPESPTPARPAAPTFKPAIAPVKNTWPLQSQCPVFYGNPASQGWLQANTVDVKCPWILRMGAQVVPYILIHKKCAASLTRVLGAIWDAVGHDAAKIAALRYDQYDGSFDYRPIRGSTGGFLSMHAYACAIDWDAGENEQHSQKHLFQDDSLLVVKFKEEGWIWGGDWNPGSIDAMHVQAARVHA